MKFLTGLLLCISGIALGIWLGIWVMLIGGIIQIANNINPTNATQLAYGICKVLFSGLVGWGSFSLLFGVGLALIRDC